VRLLTSHHPRHRVSGHADPIAAAACTHVVSLEPYVLGSFDDVVLAYDLDQLTDDHYEVLARAASRQP
jgi:hypothetical protein